MGVVGSWSSGSSAECSSHSTVNTVSNPRCSLFMLFLINAHTTPCSLLLSHSHFTTLTPHYSSISYHDSGKMLEWKMSSGEWAVASRQWQVGSGEWDVARGMWRVGCGERQVGSGKWSHPPLATARSPLSTAHGEAIHH